MQRGDRLASAGLDTCSFGGELVIQLIAADLRATAGAPRLAIERDQANLRGRLIAAATANHYGAVDEWKLVIFLQEDDETIGKLDAARLLRLEGVQRGNGDLRPWLRLRGGCGDGFPDWRLSGGNERKDGEEGGPKHMPITV